MSSVKRYDFDGEGAQYGTGNSFVDFMQKSTDGDYVLYTDYAAKEQECENLKEERRDLLDGIEQLKNKIAAMTASREGYRQDAMAAVDLATRNRLCAEKAEAALLRGQQDHQQTTTVLTERVRELEDIAAAVINVHGRVPGCPFCGATWWGFGAGHHAKCAYRMAKEALAMRAVEK